MDKEAERMYLPVKFLNKKDADQMMQGRICMHPMETEKLTHLFCMYRMKLDAETERFKEIPEQVKEFGDTAVVILDPAEFFRRLSSWGGRCLGQRYQIVPIDVLYDPVWKEKDKRTLFTKDAEFAWQREVRLAALVAPNIMVIDPDPELEKDWYPEIGDLSDIAMEIPVSELIAKGFDAANLKEHVIHNLKEAKKIAKGILAREYVFFNDYSMVYPDQEWIGFWQKVFKPEEWIPITEMRSFMADGAKRPVLTFRHRDKKRRVVFLPNRVGITLADDNREILHEFMGQDARMGHEVYFRICVISHINIGDPDRKYDEYGEKTYVIDGNASFHGQEYKERALLVISPLNGKNVWGLDVFDRRLVFRYELGKNLSAANSQAMLGEIEEILCITKEQTDKLLECEDAYDGFKNL